MRQFAHVEDYLEVIVGHRNPVSGQLLNQWVADIQPIINLARYDVGVLESMALAVEQKQALTERQGELLVKIVLKYERQLLGQGVDIEPARTPVWRIPLRKMDYSCSLTRDGDQLLIRFPFNNDIIGEIRDFSKTSQGEVRWDRERKVWSAAVTEYNVSWLYAWAQVNQFKIDSALHQLMNQITEVEQEGYAIELQVNDNTLIVTHAENSLLEYIHNHLGGFDIDNLLRLVDYSSILGYTINKDITDAVIKEYGPRFYNLLANKEIKINPNTLVQGNDFTSVLDYADAMERWPVVVYEPDLSNRMLTKLHDRYGTDLQGKYIHTIKPMPNLKTIPLLISSAGMVFGGDKQMMLQSAEKVVYCAQDVYKKKNNSKVKHL